MKKHIKSRSVKYGSVSVILTVLAVVAVIVFNATLSLMAIRYEWLYVRLGGEKSFIISDECEEYINRYVISAADEYNAGLTAAGHEKEKLIITFCDDEDTIVSEDWQKHIHDSVYQIKELFPDHIEVEYLNIWEDPSTARKLGVGSTTDIVCSFADRHETMNLKDFYIYDNAYSATPVAYNGEKIIASCLMRVTQEETPICYFTANHGESFEGYEFMRTVVEAGYTIGFLDLFADEIPEDCSLLITFDPKQDLIAADGVSTVSETDKLDAYMSAGGKYMVFLSADTFVSGGRVNLEGFLEEWGIKYSHEKGKDGIEKCQLIKDPSNSLTVNGYTIISENASSGLGESVMAGLPSNNVFGNSTRITFADNFVKSEDGSYIAVSDGVTRVAGPLMVSHASAEAWAGGRAVARASDDSFVLMALSTQECANGETACLIASASVEFASDDHMKSAVIGNSRTMTGIFKYLGRDNAPVDLTFSYFGSTEIETLTTKTANTVTVLLALIPTVLCVAAGIFVLVRRRYS